MIEDVKPLIAEGFAVILLHPRSKRPVGEKWQKAPVASYDALRARYKEGQNVGVRLGKPSKMADGFLHAIDLDIRMADEADAAWDRLEELFPNVNFKRFPRVQSGSGGESRHIYFVSDDAFPSSKLAHSGKQFTDEEGKKHWTWEIELFGTGKQVALPPSIHPDTGKPYRWLREPDFDLGIPSIAADEIAELVYGDEDDEPGDVEPLGISYAEAEEVLKHLDLDYWCDDREGWRNVGMALHHEFNGSKEAFAIWVAFSKQSRKFEIDVCKQQWRSFKGNREKPIRMATVMQAARDSQLRESFEDDDEEDEIEERQERPAEPAEAREEPSEPKVASTIFQPVPPSLLKVPGVLQDVVDFYNQNARVDQPEFAVLAALAVGSVIASRNHVTNLDNYSSLYLVGVGGSGSGKEFMRTTVARVLHAADLAEHFLGPERFTSEGAILTRLMVKPKTVLLTDEFGKKLNEDRGGTNSHTEGVYTAYMSLFSQLGGSWTPSGYSGMGKTKEEIKAILERTVSRPALTICANTTPSTFYEAIAGSDVASGFISRLLIVQSPRDLQKQKIFVAKARISSRLIKWCKEIARQCGDAPDADDDDMDDGGTQLGIDPNAEVAPKLIPFTSKAMEYLQEVVEEERIERQRELQKVGLPELFNRSREIAQRIALVVALSDGYDRIQVKHIEWAWDYVKFYHNQTASSFLANLGRGELHQIADHIAALVKESAEDGLTRREISNRSRTYRALNTRDSNEVEALLKRDHGITEFTFAGRKGRKRVAFMLPKFAKKRKRDEE